MTDKKKIGVFIPTYHRADNLWRVQANLYENTPRELFNFYFIVEENDTRSHDVIKALSANLIINQGKACYGDAINTAYRETHEPYFFCGADDLGFQKEWAQNVLSHMKKNIYVVGTNDLGNPQVAEGMTATHYLVAREYIQKQSGRVDEKNIVLYPYEHNYTDTEFIETAKSRKVFVYCPKSIVEHLHWAWGKARMDETYKKGLNADPRDKTIFNSRQHLWQ